MINVIKGLLEKNHDISDWSIHETHTISEELFFIKKAIDMNRSKDVRHYRITVYVNVEDGGKTFTGMATYRIHPTMNEQEIDQVIRNATFSARFAKNKAFQLVDPSETQVTAPDKLSKVALTEGVLAISDKLYKPDQHEHGLINSSEIFVNHTYHRIMNSKGVDVSYQNQECVLEVLTQWKEGNQDVEIYDEYHYTDVDMAIEERIEEQLMRAKGKSQAKPMPLLKDIPIILRAAEAKEILNYYVRHANAMSVYEGISQFEPGKSIQGDVKGDYVHITLNPMMANSTKSAPVDGDGMVLSKVDLITDGVLNGYHGSNQYAQYLGIQPTGHIENIEVGSGSKAYEDMKKEPHIEILSFSSFDVESVSGSFGGEIRLARYFDGKNYQTLTGGSLSAHIKEIQENMYFTKEMEQVDHYFGPKALTFVGYIASA